MRRLFISALAFVGLSAPAHAVAILVTMTSGGVQVQDSAGTGAAPPGGFPLLDGQTLIIPKGGLAVVLSQGSAEQIVGPKTFGTGEQVGTSDAAPDQNALSSVMGRQSSTSTVGATRGAGGFSLLRPVEGSALTQLGSIRWQCSGCEDQDIELIALETFEPIWSGSGALDLGYDGDPLEPGEYAIKVEDRYLAFTVVTPDEASKVGEAAQQARGLAKDLKLADQVAVEAAVWSHAGMSTEALYAVDRALAEHPGDPALEALLHSYQAMVRPE